MAQQPETEYEAAYQMWTRLTDTRTGMLWILGSDQHPQPMSHFVDEDSGVIWFITASDTDLAVALGSGAQAGFTYQSKKGDYHASLRGLLEPIKDEAKLDELWSIPVGAWFEDGREDPKVRLLRFTPREAAIWASEGNPVLVGLRMINAAMRDDVNEPDVGVHHVIEFDKVA